jgi:hypothetical protein
MVDADQMFLDGLLLPLQLVSHGDEEDGVAEHKQPAFLRSLSLESSQRMLVSASKRHQLTQPASLNSSPSCWYHYRAGAQTQKKQRLRDCDDLCATTGHPSHLHPKAACSSTIPCTTPAHTTTKSPIPITQQQIKHHPSPQI